MFYVCRLEDLQCHHQLRFPLLPAYHPRPPAKLLQWSGPGFPLRQNQSRPPETPALTALVLQLHLSPKNSLLRKSQMWSHLDMLLWLLRSPAGQTRPGHKRKKCLRRSLNLSLHLQWAKIAQIKPSKPRLKARSQLTPRKTRDWRNGHMTRLTPKTTRWRTRKEVLKRRSGRRMLGEEKVRDLLKEEQWMAP